MQQSNTRLGGHPASCLLLNSLFPRLRPRPRGSVAGARTLPGYLLSAPGGLGRGKGLGCGKALHTGCWRGALPPSPSSHGAGDPPLNSIPKHLGLPCRATQPGWEGGGLPSPLPSPSDPGLPWWGGGESWSTWGPRLLAAEGTELRWPRHSPPPRAPVSRTVPALWAASRAHGSSSRGRFLSVLGIRGRCCPNTPLSTEEGVDVAVLAPRTSCSDPHGLPRHPPSSLEKSRVDALPWAKLQSG